MRKNDLIKLLSEIDGNPEIVLWNGYAQDFMKVDRLVESDLVKMTKSHFLEMLRLEKCVDVKDWSAQLTDDEINHGLECYRKNYEWEVNEYVTTDDIQNKRYQRKRVVYVDAKTAWEKYVRQTRGGSILTCYHMSQKYGMNQI